MKNLKLLAVLIILCSMVGCTRDKKVNCTNHQLPGAYFPAYPKSWWNYNNFNSEIVKFEISADYKECEGGCRPVFLNLDKCITKNSLIQRFYIGQGQSATVRSPIYSTHKDSVLICPISFSTFEEQNAFQFIEHVRYRRKATAIDTSIAVNGKSYTNVLVMYEFNVYDSLHRYYDYFAKNVGLIKRDSVDVNDSTNLIEILTLDDYYIDN